MLARSAARRLGDSAAWRPVSSPAWWERPRNRSHVAAHDQTTKPSRGHLRLVGLKTPADLSAKQTRARGVTTKNVNLDWGSACASATPSDDDGELLVRASAVLKSQGRRKLAPWETRSSLGARKLALCPRRIMRENPWKMCPPPCAPCWLLAGRILWVLAGACQFSTVWAGLRLIHHHREIRGENARGVASYDATGPGYVWYYFMIANGGRDLSQYIKNVVLFERVRPRSRSEFRPPADCS